MSFIANVNMVSDKLDAIVNLNSKVSYEDVNILRRLGEVDINPIIRDLDKGLFLDSRYIAIDLLTNYIDYREDMPLVEKQEMFLNNSIRPMYYGIQFHFYDGKVEQIEFEQNGAIVELSTNEELYAFLYENQYVLRVTENIVISKRPLDYGSSAVIITDNYYNLSNVRAISLLTSTPELVKGNMQTSFADTTSSLLFVLVYFMELKKISDNLDVLIHIPTEVVNLYNHIAELHNKLIEKADDYLHIYKRIKDELLKLDKDITKKLKDIYQDVLKLKTATQTYHDDILKYRQYIVGVVANLDNFSEKLDTYYSEISEWYNNIEYMLDAFKDLGAGDVGQVLTMTVNSDNELVASWQDINVVDSSGNFLYVLPTATVSRLGGIKVGTGLTIDLDGTLHTVVQQSDIDDLENKLAALQQEVDDLENDFNTLNNFVTNGGNVGGVSLMSQPIVTSPATVGDTQTIKLTIDEPTTSFANIVSYEVVVDYNTTYTFNV